jgi:hypothetical protein
MRPPRNSRVQGGGCIVVWMSQKLTPTDLARLDTDKPFRVGSALSGEVAKRTGLRGRFHRLANRVFSVATRCPACDQPNPADARFCGACGGTLHLPPHLVSCPRCGVVGQATATVCFWCHGPMQGRRADAQVSSLAVRAYGLLRRSPLVVVGTVVFAAIAVVAYTIYGQRPSVEAPRPQPAAASIETSVSVAPVESPQPAEPPEAKTAATRVARTQPISTSPAGERKPSRPEACTEAVAALGLCATTGKAGGPATKPLRATDVGKAGGQEPPDPTCSEAAGVLGLCTPKPH